MTGAWICTRSSRRATDAGRMDVVAIALALVAFLALLGLLEGLERV